MDKEREALVAKLQAMADYTKVGHSMNSYDVSILKQAAAALTAPQQEPVAEKIYDGWFRVEVTDSKGQVVAIETEMLAGRNIGDEEDLVIRHAIQHLSSFVGACEPPAPQPDGVVVPRDQLEHWAEYWNGSANEKAMSDALEHILGEVDNLLAQEAK